MKIALAGSVGSSVRTLEGLIRHRSDLVGVLGLDESQAKRVSGYANLAPLAHAAGVPFAPFTRINSVETIAVLQQWKPDVLFVVGLSQMVRLEVRQTARIGCVGFHPTRLPLGRGRAPVAWTILDGVPAAATFFELSDEPDAGGILAQEPFSVAAADYASDVMTKLEEAIDRILDRWLPSLLAGHWAPVPQDDSSATFYGVRRPEDGLIDWSATANDLARLVRATSTPHPGAFTFVNDRKLLVWRASVDPDCRVRGVQGRIVATGDYGAVVQTGDGHLRLEHVRYADDPEREVAMQVGMKLGFDTATAFERLADRMTKLEHTKTRAELETD